jgi:Family of unknown function (DUF5947)
MTSGLRRFVGRSPIEFAQRTAATAPVGEACEMCGAGIIAEHPHVVGLERRNLMCACRPCYLLFTQEGAARGKYRAVPDRYLSDPAGELSQAQWDALQVPVGMAFFFHNSLLGRVVAQYPSPAGATESLLNLEAWESVVAVNRLAAELTPDVEALIVRRDRENDETYLVPIDVCYELVGRLRMHWTGFDGGPEARADITAFFDRVRSRSRPLEVSDA